MNEVASKLRGWRTNTMFILTFVLGVMVGMMVEKLSNTNYETNPKTIQYEQQKALANEGK